MNIRIASERDLPQIVEIYNQAVAQIGATADLSPVSVESRLGWFANHNPDAYPIWVAEQSKCVLGWCSLSAYRPRRMALCHTAEISYYVHKDHRRKGVASTLIQYAISQCPALKIKNLFALLLEVNVPSIRILEKFGFVKWGRMPDVAELGGKTCGHLIYGFVTESRRWSHVGEPVMKEITFADIREEDLPVILDIYNHYIATTTVTFDSEPISMETFQTRVLLNHNLYKSYVICQTNEIVGFCFLSQFEKHELYNRTAELGVYLKPEYTRQGLGTKAVRHMEQVAAEKQLKMLIASISGENISSINLFRKLGWQECARFKRVGEKWNRAIDVIFFQKSLENDITVSRC